MILVAAAVPDYKMGGKKERKTQRGRRKKRSFKRRDIGYLPREIASLN